MSRIIFLITWFGPWPRWMRLYLESCRWNPSIEFAIISDAPAPPDLPPNVRIIAYSFEGYRAHVAHRLGIRPKWDSPYKLCDLKPALAYLHPDLVEGHDFWGFGDIDVILGDLRAFLDEETLAHDLVSTHDDIVAGHLCVVRNSPRMVTAFRRPLHWRWLLSAPAHKSFDERIFSMLFAGDAKRREHGIHRFLIPRMGGALFREQYSTPLPRLRWIDGGHDYPAEWHWNQGHLTTSASGAREFMYLHFTHWASKRWAGGKRAIWDDVDPLVRVTGDRATSFRIAADGFSDWAPDA